MSVYVHLMPFSWNSCCISKMSRSAGCNQCNKQIFDLLSIRMPFISLNEENCIFIPLDKKNFIPLPQQKKYVDQQSCPTNYSSGEVVVLLRMSRVSLFLAWISF